jgi:competence protein ComFB
MDIHNVMEEFVIGEVDSICDSFKKEGKDSQICTCDQCRRDTVCYVLNRIKPHYVVSHRGVLRESMEDIQDQQDKADVTALIYEGIRRVSHNQRPYADHDREEAKAASHAPLFNIPTIMGRVFNGLNFSPAFDCLMELYRDGGLVAMKDQNWQNPFTLQPQTAGVFNMWPAPVPASAPNLHDSFQYMIKISGGGYEELYYSFTIPVISEIGSSTFSMDRTFKLPDLYLFPPGEEKGQLSLV